MTGLQGKQLLNSIQLFHFQVERSNSLMCISPLSQITIFKPLSCQIVHFFYRHKKHVHVPSKENLTAWMLSSALQNHKLTTSNCDKLNKCGLDYSGQHICLSCNGSSGSHKNGFEIKTVFNGNPSVKAARVWPRGQRITSERKSDLPHQHLNSYCFCQWTVDKNSSIC